MTDRLDLLNFSGARLKNPPRATVWVLVVMQLLLIELSPVRAATTIVDMTGFRFVPAQSSIKVGDTVLWTNLDTVFHNTLSGSNGVPDGKWSCPLFGNGGSFAFTFTNTAPGLYNYFCAPHFSIGMVGSITVHAANVPPTVTVTNPVNGATFLAGANILMQATASDVDGHVVRVDFFANSALVGSATNAPYSATLLSAAAGSYALSAVAVDDAGASSTPSVVNIVVQPQNLLPTIAITNPVDGQIFLAGTNVLIEAAAADSDGQVTQVVFFVNGNPLGTLTNTPYTVLWTNVAVGNYTLTATATDDAGATSAAPAVAVSVIQPTFAPTILTQPRSQTNIIGTTVSFSVSVSGTPPFAYEWQFNGADLSGATNDTLTLTNVQFSNAGPYLVIVTNSAGAATSQVAVLTVTLPPNIPPVVTLTNPVNGTRFPLGAPVTMIADAHDPDGTVVQVKFFVGTNLVGILTNAPFRLLVDSSRFQLGRNLLAALATDDRGGTNLSPAVAITFHAPPTISLTQPGPGLRVPLGQSMTLAATVASMGTSITNVDFFNGQARIGSAATAPFAITWAPNQALPYSLTAVAYDDLGQAATSAPVAIRVFLPETTRPLVAITNSPANFTRLKSPLVYLAGAASDDTGLDHVEAQVGGGDYVAVSGTTQWSGTVTLAPGNNIVHVRSVDLAGNTSFPATRYFTYISEAVLTVQVVGNGTVTPDLDGHTLQIGKVYTVTARPAAGQVFAGWQGVTVGASAPRLSFTMASNLVLVATFVPNPFVELSGAYSGLFLNSNAIIPPTTGSFKLQLAQSGSFSGKVAMNGTTYSFHGQFSPQGATSVAVMRRNLAPVILNLQLDLAGSAHAVQGTATDGVWVSDVLGYPAGYNARSSPAPQSGQRPFVLKWTLLPDAAEAGSGVAYINPSGAVNARGNLVDGRKFVAVTTLAANGLAPFYLSLSRGTDVLIGWLSIPPASDASTRGNLFWTTTAPDGVSGPITIAPGP
jgi:plastocyanin